MDFYFVLNEIKSKKSWKLIRKVLPQHTDHAGIMWHGSYLNFLEEARINALSRVGLSYSELSSIGFEIPVISMQIKYKLPFVHGEEFELITQFKFAKNIRLKCESYFLKNNGDIGAEALIDLVVVKKNNDSIKIVRELPFKIKNFLSLLETGF